MWEDIYEKLREWLAAQQGFVNPITGQDLWDPTKEGSLPLEGQVWENVQPILSEQAYGPITSDVDQASIFAEKQAEMAGRSGLGRESYVPKITEEEEDDDDLLNKLFLMSMMENLQGGDIGQAPAVVAGGGRREFPTMMRQFAPWEREKPYWWMR
jgi:hypothetical protein|tara:strand:- start:262 stop:726 length:465 start_codon:yes stop_codon:yes gene_type:complete